LPLQLAKEGIHRVVQRKLGLKVKEPELSAWARFANSLGKGKEVTVGIVGKYSRGDTYLSISQALVHAGAAAGACVKIKWIDCEHFCEKDFGDIDAMITPGGFGERGTEGKIGAIRWARQNKVPWLGLCLGFQLAVVEFARTELGLDANSTEFDSETKEPVIIPHWEARHDALGGTMRLGAIEVELDKGSACAKLYGKTKVSERHRHRYGLNPSYREALEAKGLKFTGVAPCDDTIEVLEVPGQFFIGVQFHPEFLSRPLEPHPLFLGLVQAAMPE
jgi:CTP synthase